MLYDCAEYLWIEVYKIKNRTGRVLWETRRCLELQQGSGCTGSRANRGVSSKRNRDGWVSATPSVQIEDRPADGMMREFSRL